MPFFKGVASRMIMQAPGPFYKGSRSKLTASTTNAENTKTLPRRNLIRSRESGRRGMCTHFPALVIKLVQRRNMKPQ